MNARLASLQPYPFEKLRTLLAASVPPALAPIRLSLGEPQHANPFYQIYEGAAMLAGAEPLFLNQTADRTASGSISTR